jgi:hypothetical protein
MNFILLILLISIQLPAFSQPIKNLYVFSEKDDDDFRRCNLSSEGLVATAKSTLRYNRINVSNQFNSDLDLWIAPSVIPINDNFCAAAVSIQIYKRGVISFSTGAMIGDHVLCNKTSIGTYKIQNTQTQWNNAVREMIELCISKIESNLTK